MTPEEEIDRAEEQFRAALRSLMGGDTGPMGALLSQADDATMFLGWGGYERGGEQVRERWEWAATRFAARASGDAGPEVETLSRVVSGDLAYTTTITRSTVRLAGQVEPVPLALRATHVYRREDGVWRLAHRHADTLTPRQ